MEKFFERLGLDSKTIYSIAIFVSIGLIVGAMIAISLEIVGAKYSCEELGMDYKFVIPYNHLCNNRSFFKYSDGSWDVSKEINFSEVIKNTKYILP